MALDTTIGSLTADSYITVTDADTFFATEAHPNDNNVWLDLSDAEKEVYLRRARTQMDLSYDWIGIRASEGDGITEGQALEWPRSYVPRDGWKASSKKRDPYLPGEAQDDNPLLLLDGVVYLPNTVIPSDIKKGQCSMALDFAVKDRAGDSQLNHLKSISADGSKIEWRDGVPASQGTISSKVHDYLRKYGKLNKSLNSESKTGITNRKMSRV